nr:substrate-binding domain-containing protein [[Clostridium] innocuum]
MTLNNPFFNVIDDEVRNVVEANGDVLISLDPALDLQKQKEQIHYLIEQGVSALIINPVDFTGLSEELKEARKRIYRSLLWIRMYLMRILSRIL